MKDQMKFIELLFEGLSLSVARHIKNNENADKKGVYFSENYMNRNTGKTALKRRITLLRQELLNLERMIDEG